MDAIFLGIAFHSRRSIYSVTEKTVAWIASTDNIRNHWSTMKPYANIYMTTLWIVRINQRFIGSNDSIDCKLSYSLRMIIWLFFNQICDR